MGNVFVHQCNVATNWLAVKNHQLLFYTAADVRTDQSISWTLTPPHLLRSKPCSSYGHFTWRS